MCGVVGFSGKGGSRAQFVALSCKQSCIRGVHAFGAAWIDTGGRLRYVRSVSYAAVNGALSQTPCPTASSSTTATAQAATTSFLRTTSLSCTQTRASPSYSTARWIWGQRRRWRSAAATTLRSENDRGRLVLLDALAGDPFRRIGKETGASFAGIVLGVQADGSPYMYALRNEKRPLWAFETSAGYFIASTRDIASRAKLDTLSRAFP